MWIFLSLDLELKIVWVERPEERPKSVSELSIVVVEHREN